MYNILVKVGESDELSLLWPIIQRADHLKTGVPRLLRHGLAHLGNQINRQWTDDDEVAS